MSEPYRIRIRLPNGAEIEAAGTEEYVRAERESFMAAASHLKESEPAPAPIKEESAPPIHPTQFHQTGSPDRRSGVRPPAWESIIENTKGPNIRLRSKLLGENKAGEDACLVLLAASQKLLNQPKPTAAQLARWLRASGYPIQRMDRTLATAIEKGDILASGSRRARRYELTGPGRVKAFLLAQQLTELVTGEPN